MTNTAQTNFLTTAAATVTRLYRQLSRLPGRQAHEQAEPVKVHADLCLAQTARRTRHYAELALPEALLQAFSTEPLAAGDTRFVGREEQSNRLLAALEMWRAGHSSMVAVTGLQGCGISSFLQQLPTRVADSESCNYCKLTHRPYDINDTLLMLGAVVGGEPSVGSVEELVEYINGLPPSVFVIDNGHFLACRIMGANEAIRIFGAVMVATQQRHLWVLGCQEYAWRRLVYVYRADRYFADRVELPLFSELELGQCLTNRLQASGFALSAGSTGESVQQPTLLARQSSTLYKLSNGKPDYAFFYFLGSVLVHDESRQLELQPVVPPDFSILKQLISEELFTLAEVAAHGQLTIDDHRAVFRCSRDESWLLLERLYRQCLLDKHETTAEPEYHLVPQYSNVIGSYLANANYLY
ncbi:MAG: ATP-binding protein [Gammaproteobacteria bacterium]